MYFKMAKNVKSLIIFARDCSREKTKRRLKLNFRRLRTGKRQVVRFYSLYWLYRIKNTMKKLPQIVYKLANEFLNFKMAKNIYF